MGMKPQCICQFLKLKMEFSPVSNSFPSSTIHFWICTGLSGASQGSCCPGNNAHEQMPVSYNLEERAAIQVIYIKIKFILFPTE